MPFKSEKQKKWMFANNPALARKWLNKYHHNAGTVVQDDGNPRVRRNRYYNEYIGRRNKGDQEALSMKFPAWYEKYDGKLDITGKAVLSDKEAIRMLLDFVPGVGDALTAYDSIEALSNKEYAAAAILGVAAAVGLVPGIGDAASVALKRVVSSLPTADVVGITRALKEGDTEFLTGWKRTQDAKAAGARPLKYKIVHVTHPDGTVSELSGATAAQSIADATGKSIKTVRNNITNGKPTVASDGTEYFVPTEKHPKPVRKADARETTIGKAIGPDGKPYNGTFSDLMREHGIDPRGGEASGIKQQLARGHEWNGYRLSGVAEFKYRNALNIVKSAVKQSNYESAGSRFGALGRLKGVEARKKFVAALEAKMKDPSVKLSDEYEQIVDDLQGWESSDAIKVRKYGEKVDADRFAKSHERLVKLGIPNASDADVDVFSNLYRKFRLPKPSKYDSVSTDYANNGFMTTRVDFQKEVQKVLSEDPRMLKSLESRKGMSSKEAADAGILKNETAFVKEAYRNVYRRFMIQHHGDNWYKGFADLFDKYNPELNQIAGSVEDSVLDVLEEMEFTGIST